MNDLWLKFCSGLVVLTLWTGAAFANEHFGMSWSHSQFNDPYNKGRMTSLVTIGVPETDNRLGTATCFAGSTAGFPTLELAANVSNLRSGAGVDVTFYSDRGPMTYRGQVKAPLSEEDYYGVRLDIGWDDPLWTVLSRMSAIAYDVRGQKIQLPLRGSSQAIDRFLSECRIYQGGAAPANAGGGNQASDPRWATCDTLANKVPLNSDTPVTLTFNNQSDGFRTVMWIGFDGRAKEYAALNPGESYTINTYLTHPWMFTDGPGNCIEMFMPQLGVSTFNISAPGRYFGAE